ncbi:similar to Saccharomyces cerevisiae YOL025W LAG2 Protein that negatively regulates the SCF E3-ubiquitin ligase by interacting with and preventing neddyation of the cullin subunit, Cdc53p [Maudiozyma barnettii]|uniref:Similar to Saccharomyces cerevisiae YOL025W LAG2 Protein that negatively regulates the SCF E3-ubiquitin ligase by interacting with and preventing neddyation of the cullin subunit, Cdc53p n=1 Tax=Maudiozyma barnettii TaxID=61262 RepID=A0A8H2VEY8_9SACH|nr:Lag2p [Kazachstania barnettii]CAB4254245.1 similar to Saccharomyces cerevisiae YOL025W LAG2 Protein that negatively regulates the SCF E3-ubiquitin ligase by interacting with and preventing neddyation of the cullin subunit, Cdc53p [Kazachstania barnettii]CAD1782001.1 similar to Saccharomyces cerevisiae YOL025W LAG2 Protein that negatively regulates the SCF E3-ubiquitin ligase by interacting with and preventing neddyation of the cullin subunit, Cdc53p [Kazachstania barnettii]
MIILKIIEQYYESTDSDLQYMALRNEFTITDIDNDVSLLMNKLVLPILLRETNMDIINLVCYEFLPRFVECIRNNYSVNRDIFKFTENKVLTPIVTNIRVENRSLIFLQCLKVLCKKIYDLIDITQKEKNRNEKFNVPSIIFNTDSTFVFRTLTNIKETKLIETEKYLCYETLNYLLPLYFDGHTHCLPKDILIMLLKEYSQEELINPNTQNLLDNLCRLTSPIELSYAAEYIDDYVLLEMSKCWYKFNILVDEYFDTRLLPKLEVTKIGNKPDFINTLRIITNFEPYYSTRILHIALPYLAQDNVIRLMKCCIKLVNILDIAINERKLENDILSKSSNHISDEYNEDNILVSNNDNIVSSSKPKSKINNNETRDDKYLEELSLATETYDFGNDDEEEDVFMEDDDVNDTNKNVLNDVHDSESADSDKRITNEEFSNIEQHENEDGIQQVELIKSMILSILKNCDISLQTERYFMEMEDISFYTSYRNMGLTADKTAIVTLFKFHSNVKQIDLQKILTDNDYYQYFTKDDIFSTLDYKSASSVDNLTDLQFCVDIMEKLIRDDNFELNIRDQSILSLIVLPHIKKNKQFVRVLKVGNMKQKVDNGLATRTSIYSILSQMEKLPYNVACKILEEVVVHGLKDKNNTIQYLSEKIIEKILNEYYNTIQGLAQGWYQVAIMNKLLDIIYGSSAVSTTETSVLSNLIDTYPSVPPRHDD